MLTEEIKKKIYLFGLIIAAVLGAIFLVFAVFLNRGKLTVISKAPYVLQIGSFKNLACSNDVCGTELAPGEYTITLRTQGYRDLVKKIIVPIGGEYKEELAPEFIPFVAPVNKEELNGLEGTAQISSDMIKKLPDTKYFYDKNYLVYLAKNPETLKQTLYIRTIESGQPGPEKAVASFIRDFKQYRIIPDIEGRQKIAIIDYDGIASVLYFVDLETKTRVNIMEFPFINNLKWLPGSDDFLFEGRGSDELTTSLYLYKEQTKETVKLNIAASLENVAMPNSNDLIVVTAQPLQGQSDSLDLEGRLVTLEELDASPTSAAIAAGLPLEIRPKMNIINFSLRNMQGRLLKTVSELPLPGFVMLREDKRGLYLIYPDSAYVFLFSGE